MNDRHSLRLQNYDYSSAGYYFITCVVQGRKCLLGNIDNGAYSVSPFGEIVEKTWNELPSYYGNLTLDAFIVMPNHIHGILILSESEYAVSPQHGIPEIIRALKSFSARKINEFQNSAGIRFWQRNYYEHIIRSDEDLNQIRKYIDGNPGQ